MFGAIFFTVTSLALLVQLVLATIESNRRAAAFERRLRKLTARRRRPALVAEPQYATDEEPPF